MGARGRGSEWARGRVGVVDPTYTNFRTKPFRPRPSSELHNKTGLYNPFFGDFPCSAQTLLRPTQEKGFAQSLFRWFSICRRARIQSVILLLIFFADLALGASLGPPSSNFRDLRFSTTRDPRSTNILTTEGAPLSFFPPFLQ